MAAVQSSYHLPATEVYQHRITWQICIETSLSVWLQVAAVQDFLRSTALGLAAVAAVTTSGAAIPDLVSVILRNTNLRYKYRDSNRTPLCTRRKQRLM